MFIAIVKPASTSVWITKFNVELSSHSRLVLSFFVNAHSILRLNSRNSRDGTVSLNFNFSIEAEKIPHLHRDVVKAKLMRTQHAINNTQTKYN